MINLDELTATNRSVSETTFSIMLKCYNCKHEFKKLIPKGYMIKTDAGKLPYAIKGDGKETIKFTCPACSTGNRIRDMEY